MMRRWLWRESRLMPMTMTVTKEAGGERVREKEAVAVVVGNYLERFCVYIL